MDALTVAAMSALLISGPGPAAPSGVAPPSEVTAGKPDTAGQWDGEIAEAAQRFTMPERWIRAVIAAESAGDARAVSPKGAMGLMQLMPQTWRTMRDEYALGNDPFDPHDNVMAGTAFLKAMYDRFGAPAFLAAYNAGPQAMQDVLSGIRTLPDESRLFMDKIGAALDLPGPANGPATTLTITSGAQNRLFFAGGITTPDQPIQPSWRQLFAPLGQAGSGTKTGR